MNVVFMALDTSRADHMGCYGYGLKTTPNIDRFAQDAVLFENCVAPGIPTHPGYTSMLTGMHPLTHKIVCHGGSKILDSKIAMISEILYRNGFTTIAVDNLVATGAPWFVRGYEYYVFTGGITVISKGEKITGDVVTDKALNFLKLWGKGFLGSKPLFMFIHYWDPHTPYLPPKGFKGSFYKPVSARKPLREMLEETLWGKLLLEWWIKDVLKEGFDDKGYVDSLYDDEILYIDSNVSRVLECLKDLGIYNDTVIVITADHGELLGEHGIFYDHHGLYEGDIHIPLIVKAPNLPSGVRIKGLVTHEDIAPTILELLGVKTNIEFDGKPLTNMVKTEGRIREFVVCLENTRMTKRAIRTENWKLIQTLRPDVYDNPAGNIELYSLEKDSCEEENLAEEEEDVLRDMLFRLENWYVRKLRGEVDPLAVQPISLPIETSRV